MITMSMLPRSQWLGMIHIDSIKTRNKPIEPPKKPEAAPFFLPPAAGVNAGRDPVFISEEDRARVRKAAAAAWGDKDDVGSGRRPSRQDTRGRRGRRSGRRTQRHPPAPDARPRRRRQAPPRLDHRPIPSPPCSTRITATKTWRPVLRLPQVRLPVQSSTSSSAASTTFEFDVGTHPDDQA